MKSTLENLEDAPGKRLVKLSLTVEEAEFDRDIDQAFRKIATEVRLPGFRNGKVPRKVLEARIGLAPAREQALRDAIPVYLASAVREHDIDLIATPQVEITGGEEEGPVSFDATCEVRPEITVPGYGGLRVELASPLASDEDVDQAVRAELRRHGSLVDVDRPVQSGDHVTINLNGTRDGAPVIGLTTEDWLYEVGQGWVAPTFDAELLNAGMEFYNLAGEVAKKGAQTGEAVKVPASVSFDLVGQSAKVAEVKYGVVPGKAAAADALEGIEGTGKEPGKDDGPRKPLGPRAPLKKK